MASDSAPKSPRSLSLVEAVKMTDTIETIIDEHREDC
jgi:hypothetical protein